MIVSPRRRLFDRALFAGFALFLAIQCYAQSYKNFRLAVYVPATVVARMGDPEWLEQSWAEISAGLKIDKVYLETYRSRFIVPEQTIEQVKRFFIDHGVQVAGGIAFSDRGTTGQFETHHYTTPADRAYVKAISEMTARHFNEIILDDFFFHMGKTDADIAAKGNRSWTQFRLDLMDEVSRDLIVGPAKRVNPKVKFVIKFPNWYEHFQGMGYDLDKEPKIFDGIYTGTETRDPETTDQHLQQYESFQIIRYFDNIAPGRNGGGWVDTFSIQYLDRYAEQLWDTVFAKAPEMMLFNYGDLPRPAIPGKRDAWAKEDTSFNFDQMAGGVGHPNMAKVAGYSLAKADAVLGALGTPIGIAAYKPYQSTGEDFLHNWLGMIGIPINLSPQFPVNAPTILLTESAKFDPNIVAKIKGQLKAGKNVIITTGLLRALKGRGIGDIAEIEFNGNTAMVTNYYGAYGSGDGGSLGTNDDKRAIEFPEIRFITNDSWPVVRGQANGNGYPILLMDHYSKGTLYVLAIPDNFSDLYSMPRSALTNIKTLIMGDFPIKLDAPAKVALFPYDNNSLVVESFRDTDTQVNIVTTGGFTKLRNVATGEEVVGEVVGRQRWEAPAPPAVRFSVTLPPHSFAAFVEER